MFNDFFVSYTINHCDVNMFNDFFVSYTLNHYSSLFNSSLQMHSIFHQFDPHVKWLGCQANESEIPLLHEFNDTANENGSSIEVSIPCRKVDWLLFIIWFFCVLLNYSFLFEIIRRKGAYFMWQWLVHEKNFSFCILWWMRIGRFELHRIYVPLPYLIVLFLRLITFRCFSRHDFSKKFQIICMRFRCALLVILCNYSFS